MRGIASRWGTWWVLACLGVGVWLVLAAQRCQSKIPTGEACTGVEQFAFDSDWFLLPVIAAAVAGGALLGFLQDRVYAAASRASR